MKSKLMSAVVISTFIVGCNNANDHEHSVEQHEVKALNSVENNNDNKRLNLKNEMGDHALLNKAAQKFNQSISLNGNKFTLVDGKLEQGAQVYNTLMNEYGTIKGSLVLVLSDEGVFNKSYFKTVKKIAKKTFRVWPTKKDDLYLVYQDLTRNANFSVVELEVDYSPISKQQTH